MGKPEPFVCMRCGKGYWDIGNCPVHLDEPLLDASDREVAMFLMRDDDEARSKAYMRWIFLGVLVGLGASILVSIGLTAVLRGFPTRLVAYLLVGGVLAGGSGGTYLASRLFKPRFRRFTDKLIGI